MPPNRERAWSSVGNAETGPAQAPIILDLSRLLSRVLHPTPTGVDRVELAYARELLRAAPERLSFAAVHPVRGYGRLPTSTVLAFLDAVERRWEHEGDVPEAIARRFALRWLTALWARSGRAPLSGQPPIFLQSSPNNLVKPNVIATILAKEGARFACLVHDLIPLEYPEYARPDGAALHGRRIRTLTHFADAIIANSHATLASLQPWISQSGRDPVTAVAHLGGPHLYEVASLRAPERPYFISIGTIEPRKNHLLLLNIWRRLAEERGPRTIPKLILVGRRGWENEQVIDMLERCPALVDCVEERGRLPDKDVRTLLAGAQALLLPSFAEGYGMPVTEALMLDTPVICSDLPALREAAGNVAEFLDPLDGPSWISAISQFSSPASAAAAAQAERRRSWTAPSWQEHIAIVLQLLHKLPA